jgi:hypothetical protein
MSYHERKTKANYELVYFVVSDLRLTVASQRYSGGPKWRTSGHYQRRGCFLNEKDIKSLYEKHWAAEINGTYYELKRDHSGSRFSYTRRVKQWDRQIAARIFL